jgi:arginine decarboxylase
MFPIPKRVFLTRGTGKHRERLTAFEHALRDADIEQQNLVSVSSILPPHCEPIASGVGIASLSPGEITFCVMARTETNEPGRWIAAGIGLARPKDIRASLFRHGRAGDERIRGRSCGHHARFHSRN